MLAAKTKLIPNLAKTNRHLAKAGLHLLSGVFTNFGWSNHPSSKSIATKERLITGKIRTANIPRGNLKKSAEVCMEIPKKLISYLNEEKVSYDVLYHAEAFTAQTIATAEHVK